MENHQTPRNTISIFLIWWIAFPLLICHCYVSWPGCLIEKRKQRQQLRLLIPIVLWTPMKFDIASQEVPTYGFERWFVDLGGYIQRWYVCFLFGGGMCFFARNPACHVGPIANHPFAWPEWSGLQDHRGPESGSKRLCCSKCRPGRGRRHKRHGGIRAEVVVVIYR